MSRRYGWGIIGCGVIAPSHIKGVRENGARAEVVGLYDLVLDRAKERQAEFDIPFATDDIDTFLARDDIDIVSICTPSGAHSDGVVAAAQAGKHILCEKPLGITHEQLDTAIAAAQEAGVKMGGVFQRRTEPISRQLRHMLQEGRFGKIVLADLLGKDYRAPEYYQSAGWRGTIRFDRGCLMNQGVHSLDLLLWLMGEPVVEVAGFWDTLRHDIEAEDTLAASLRFASGALGTVVYATSLSRRGVPSHIGIHGTEGNILLGSRGEEPLVEIGGEPVPLASERDESANGATQLVGHAAHVADLIQAIDEDREPAITGESGRSAVDVALAIYEASDTRTVVRLPLRSTHS
ncbi:MAG: oxidoreductase [Dehalococcoidia bacterium]|nr:oxidoreductase [Dehalococcoidia bacterium]